MTPEQIAALVERLRGLRKQATEERSHYYVADCCRESIDALLAMQGEIERLTRERGPCTHPSAINRGNGMRCDTCKQLVRTE
jgi:hypothetical protein